MKNIKRDIKENCRECTNDEIIDFLHHRGDFSSMSEYYREIWFFFIESQKLFEGNLKVKRKLARLHTCEMMNISEKTFWKVSNKMRKKFV